jgi:uncharacterized membrane protein
MPADVAIRTVVIEWLYLHASAAGYYSRDYARTATPPSSDETEGPAAFSSIGFLPREPEPEPEYIALLGGDVIMSWPPSISVVHPEDHENESGHS